MRHRILKLLNTHTVRQSVVTTVATFLSAGLGAVFYLIIAKTLGPSEYGVFTLSLTVVMLVVTVADVGMGQGIVRFIGEHLSSDQYLSFANLALKSKLLMGFVCWIALSVFAKPASLFIFHKADMEQQVVVIGLGVLTFLLISYSVTMAQALQRFFLWGGLQIGSNIFRLILFGAFYLLSKVTSFSALLVTSLSALAGFLVSWAWLDLRIWKAKISWPQVRSVLEFNKWTTGFSILSSVVSRLDILLASRYLDLSSLGAYSLAVTMSSLLPQISGAIGTVTSAKFAGLTSEDQAAPYLSKATIFSTLTGLGIAIAMIPVAMLVIWFTGIEYSGAFAPFMVLLASLVIFMAGNPLRDYLLYFRHTPHIFFWANLIQGVALLLSGLLLIPRYNALGASASVLFGHIFLGATCLWVYMQKSK